MNKYCKIPCFITSKINYPQVSVLFILFVTSQPTLSVQVKSFSRSAAGQHSPHQDDLRPPAVLYKTVHHLLTKYVMAG
jgi:hypothetical protein